MKINLFSIVLFVLFFLTSCKVWLEKQINNPKNEDLISKSYEKKTEEEWIDTLENVDIPENSLESALQSTFKDYAEKSCKCTNNIVKRNKINYIPVKLRKDDYRTIEVEYAKKISSASLFFYAFSSADIIKKFDNISFNPQHLILDDFYDYSIPKNNERFNNVFFSSTCSNYLKVSGKAGAKIPPASIKTALEYDADENSSLVLIGGSFSSPLHEILGKQGTSTFSQAYLGIWDYYKKEYDNGQKNDTLRYYLKSFSGFSMLEKVSSAASSKFSIAGNVNVGNTDLGASIDMGIGASSKKIYKSNNWKTFIDNNELITKRAEYFKPLPSKWEIMQHFKKLSVEISDKEPIYQNTKHLHKIIVKNLPKQSQGSWELIAPSLYENGASISVDMSHDNNNECKFIISGIPLITWFSGVQNTASVSYKLRYTNKIGEQIIDIDVNNIQFNIANEPIVHSDVVVNPDANSGNYSATISSSNIAYSWGLPMYVTDSRGIINYNVSPRVTSCTIIAPPQEYATLSISGSITTGKPFLLRLLSSRSILPDESVQDKNIFLHLDIEVEFTTTSYSKILRKFKVIAPFREITKK